MKKKQNPMPLENLPGYLKSLQENGDTGGSPLVSMGQIVMPKKRPYLQWSFAMLMVLVLSVGSVTTYNVMSTEQLTVVVDVDRGIDHQTLSQIVSDSGGKVLSVTQMEDSTFEVKLKTRKSRHSFLEWLRKNKDVKNAK